ncbi:hypothetical protein [Flavobacterium cerinum]|uniref:DUF4440 domain-containing protein n=1 Tax=Flavobacterium cerinum TaxID=2502784 RepID=A0ABY5IQN1_9FLAO|nr:hypothetical protein [Flavobacterium cerinum]UUC45148.1 hypothetical protein NOX80_16175 [Flavobacterium cerinum]
MRIFFFVAVFLICSLSFIPSPKTELESEFLEQIIVQERGSITYVRESWGWEKMKELLNRKVFYDYNLDNRNSIELTDSEYNFILNEIDANRNHIWSPKLLKNAESIDQNEIESYLLRKSQPVKSELKEHLKLNATSAVVKLKNKMPLAFSFSKPIFFRKGTLCIFAYSVVTHDNLGNYKQIAFYKKEKGKWVENLEIYNSLN